MAEIDAQIKTDIATWRKTEPTLRQNLQQKADMMQRSIDQKEDLKELVAEQEQLLKILTKEHSI
jgi:hypothetical protein